MTSYLIALPLPDEYLNDFNALRDEYKKYAPKWRITLDPHITITRPIRSDVPAEEVVEAFKAVDSLGLFSVYFKGFGAFIAKRNCVVFAEPENYKPFEDIRQIFLPIVRKVFGHEPNRWEYHPHLTLVNRLDRISALKILEGIGSPNIKMNYRFDRVCLYSKTSTDNFWNEIASTEFRT